MAKDAAAGAQGDTKAPEAGTLTGDEGKNPAANDGGKKTDDGTATAEKKAADDKAAADKKAADDKAAADKKKADDDAATAQKEKGSKEDDKSKAPDKYELELPEAAGDYLDETDVKQVEQLARSKGWTNDQAQAALNEHADGLAAMSARFREETVADATYGGDNLAETQRLARLALDKVRPANTEQGKALRRDLAKSGYGNKLSVVSFLADLGKLMDEDGHVAGGSRSGADKTDTASVLYPDNV